MPALAPQWQGCYFRLPPTTKLTDGRETETRKHQFLVSQMQLDHFRLAVQETEYPPRRRCRCATFGREWRRRPCPARRDFSGGGVIFPFFCVVRPPEDMRFEFQTKFRLFPSCTINYLVCDVVTFLCKSMCLIDIFGLPSLIYRARLKGGG